MTPSINLTTSTKSNFIKSKNMKKQKSIPPMMVEQLKARKGKKKPVKPGTVPAKVQ
ncbi:MAG: hypothetical protein NVSMB66_6300 [Candidatus Doudnabacteria bacterium]